MGNGAKIIIAVDFDDTITNRSIYPTTGTLNRRAERYVRRFAKMGLTQILWTGRVNGYYDEAVKLIDTWNLPIDCIRYEGKPMADVYIDNKSYVFGRVPWLRLYLYLAFLKMKNNLKEV